MTRVTTNHGLLITTSRECEGEKSYVIDWVLREVFGIGYEIQWDSTKVEIEISHRSRDEVIVTRQDFFAAAEENWLARTSVPTSLRTVTDSTETDHAGLSVLWFGRNQGTDDDVANDPSIASHRVIPFDLFGTIFFLISRYEEAVIEASDRHDRFPSAASVLTKYDLIDRPIGNEYIELLWKHLKDLWPWLKRKPREFRLLPSHDIDHPSLFWKPRFGTLRTSVGECRRGNLAKSLAVWKHSLDYAIQTHRRDWRKDPNDTITWLLDQSEKVGAVSSFYYIPEKTHRFDAGMPLKHPHVVDQWQRIAHREHEIGVHPGYETYLYPDRIKSGATRIRRQLENLGIDQERIGGRQHFLRWKSPETAVAWNDADLDYDSSLAFADRAGFRCGVCYEYPMYDVIRRRPLKLRQRPLIVMECTVIDDRYMALGGGEKAFDCMSHLKDQCKKYDGDFTILWHNHRLRDEREKSLYVDVLAN